MSCDQGHLHSCVSEELQTYSVGYYHESQLFSHHPLVNLSRYHTRYVIIFVCYTSSTTAIIYSVDIYTDLSRYIAIYLYMFACSQDNSGINWAGVTQFYRNLEHFRLLFSVLRNKLSISSYQRKVLLGQKKGVATACTLKLFKYKWPSKWSLTHALWFLMVHWSDHFTDLNQQKTSIPEGSVRLCI